MFRCKECGKEFEDWHALGGHMRTHWGKRAKPQDVERRDRGEGERLSQALGALSDLSPAEAWGIVVNWIIDVHRQLHEKDEQLQSYRLRLRESESRVEAVRRDLRGLGEALGQGTTGMPEPVRRQDSDSGAS